MLNFSTRSLKLCNQHLQELFQAIETDDVRALYRIEHQLSPDEECVACSYVLRAHGKVRLALVDYLKQKGFFVEQKEGHIGTEIIFWVMRLVTLAVFFGVFTFGGVYLKKMLWGNSSGWALSSFGLVGAFIIATATYVTIESWVTD